MLRFIKKVFGELREPYTLKALLMSLVLSKLEYAS
jgi:hypothetical protein